MPVHAYYKGGARERERVCGGAVVVSRAGWRRMPSPPCLSHSGRSSRDVDWLWRGASLHSWCVRRAHTGCGGLLARGQSAGDESFVSGWRAGVRRVVRLMLAAAVSSSSSRRLLLLVVVELLASECGFSLPLLSCSAGWPNLLLLSL